MSNWRYLIGPQLIDEANVSAPRAEPHPTTFEYSAWRIRGDTARVRTGWGVVTWNYEGQYLSAAAWNQLQSLIGSGGYGEVYIRTRTEEMTAEGKYQYEVFQAIMQRPQGRPVWGERYGDVSITFLLVKNPAKGYDANPAVNVSLFPGWEPTTSTSTTSTSTTISSTSTSTSMTTTSSSTSTTSTSTTSISTSTSMTSLSSTSTTTSSTSTTMTSISSTSTTISSTSTSSSSTSTTTTSTSTSSSSTSTTTTLPSGDSLNLGVNDPVSMAIDMVHGYLYVGTLESPGRVVAVRLSNFTVAKTLTLNAGEDFLYGLVIDVVGGYLYASTYTSVGMIVKMSIIQTSVDEFARVGVLSLTSAPQEWFTPTEVESVCGQEYPDNPAANFVDGLVGTDWRHQVNELHWIVLDLGEEKMVRKIRIYNWWSIAEGGGWDSFDVYVSNDPLDWGDAVAENASFPGGPPGWNEIETTDKAGRYIFLDDIDTHASLNKMFGWEFAAYVDVDGAAPYGWLICLGIDTSTTPQALYAGAYRAPGRVWKIGLDTFTVLGSLDFGAGENYPRCVTIDQGNDAYFGLYIAPGQVIPVSIPTFTEGAPVVLAAGENALKGATISLGSEYIYFTCNTDPGRVIKMKTSDMSYLSRVLYAGDTNPRPINVDYARDRLFVGLEDLPGAAVLLTAVTMAYQGKTEFPGAGLITCVALDTAIRRAYFGAKGSPGTVRRVSY